MLLIKTRLHLFRRLILSQWVFTQAKVKKVEEFANGATIAIPNDAANEARALLLLQSAGLLKLKANFDPATGTPNDITENAKKIVIKPIQMATAVRVKDEVDAIVLGNTLALEGGLNVLKTRSTMSQ